MQKLFFNVKKIILHFTTYPSPFTPLKRLIMLSFASISECALPWAWAKRARGWIYNIFVLIGHKIFIFINLKHFQDYSYY